MNVLLYSGDLSAFDWLRLAILIRGHQCYGSSDPQVVRQRVIGSRFDLLIVDQVNSDQEISVELCRRIREHPQSRTIPIWVIVERIRPDGMLAAIDSGATSVLLFPVDAQQLRTRFEVLERHHRPATHTSTSGQDLVQRVLALIDDPIAIVDRIGVIRGVSSPSGRIAGVLTEELLGVNIEVLCHSDDLPLLLATIRTAMTSQEVVGGTVVRLRGSDSDWQPIEVRAVDLHDASSVGGILLMLRDGATLERRSEQPEEVPLINPESGFATNAMFEAQIALALARGERANQPIAIIVAEIQSNQDEPIDDAELLHITGLFRGSMRAGDVVTVFDRNVIAILADDVGSVDGATAAASRVRMVIEELTGGFLANARVRVETVISHPGITTHVALMQEVLRIIDEGEARQSHYGLNDGFPLSQQSSGSDLPSQNDVDRNDVDANAGEPTVEIPDHRLQTLVQPSGVIDRFLALESQLAHLMSDNKLDKPPHHVAGHRNVTDPPALTEA